MSLLLTLLLLASDAGTAPVRGAAPLRPVTATLVGPDAQPAPGVIVMAVDAATDAVVALATSDESGRVEMRLRPRRHNFGIMSARYQIAGFEPRGGDSYQLTLRALPAPAGAAPAPGDTTPVVRSSRAILIRGRVVDEAGRPLAGVRVDGARAITWTSRPEGMRADGMILSSAFSGSDGAFVLPIPGGDTQLQARAPGLVALRFAVPNEKGVPRADRPILFMGVDTAVQEVVVSDGHVLRIRPRDSIDPEYSPPAPVRAWLRFAYGICSSGEPLRAREKRALAKYWYLDVLRQEPPNPATVSTAGCVSPAEYRQTSLAARVGAAPGGFDLAVEAP